MCPGSVVPASVDSVSPFRVGLVGPIPGSPVVVGSESPCRAGGMGPFSRSPARTDLDSAFRLVELGLFLHLLQEQALGLPGRIL